MKTEKRLTMALSVLVALMMLAVPLASSSNLFVDGGQTNSNGDAPLSASEPKESYTITLQLNGNKNSLDDVKYDNLGNPEKWHINKDGNLYTVVDKDSDLSAVFKDLYTVDSSSSPTTITSNITKEGSTLDAWKDESTGAVYGADAKGKITSDMTFSAVWILDENYCEISVIVEYKGETTEYVKAYEYVESSNQKKITVPKVGLLTDGVPKLDTYGIVVNATSDDKIKALSKEVYSFNATYGDNKEFEFTEVNSSKIATIPADSKISIKYTFDSENYSEITVKSIAFKDGKDVTLYADRNRIYTYDQIYAALTDGADDGEPSLGHIIKGAITLDPKITDKVVTDRGYELTGWNEGAEPLTSEKEAPSSVTLDAKLNGYYVIFMVNGQFEYVYVPFGELSADKTTLDITGVNHWVYIDYTSYSNGVFDSIKSFNFASSADVSAVEDVTDKTDAKEPTAVLIACFTPSSSTSYAVFDASSYTYGETGTSASSNVDPIDEQTIKGTFGNEYVQYLIIPGKSGDKISVPSIKPVYGEDSKILFISWNKYPAVTGSDVISGKSVYPVIETAYSEKDVYGKGITQYSANVVEYDYTITFYDGDEVVGTFYYYGGVPTTSITYGLVAFEIDGKAYKATYDKNGLVLNEEAGKAYENILVPDKDGYYITQWNDDDNNKDIEFKWADGKISSIKVDIKDMKDDLNLYAQFKAEKYEIVYTNTYGNVGSMSQTASVDETVKLYSDSTFVYEGYKLTGWSDRPDGNGTNYDLGASFTLNGEQYEDLKDGKVTLYAVWEKLGSGSGTGGNTGGDNDNTALYLIAGMLAVIAILAIVGILLMRRK